MDAGVLGPALERNIVGQIQKAIPLGIVLNNHPSDDSHNPLDRQLEIYTYVRLQEIDPSLEGIAKFRAVCRLSLSNHTLSLRTIDKNFQAS